MITSLTSSLDNIQPMAEQGARSRARPIDGGRRDRLQRNWRNGPRRRADFLRMQHELRAHDDGQGDACDLLGYPADGSEEALLGHGILRFPPRRPLR